MFPIGDDNRARRSTPYVTYILILINVIFFIIELIRGDVFQYDWSFVPARFLADPGGDWAHHFHRHVHARRMAAYHKQHDLPVGLR